MAKFMSPHLRLHGNPRLKAAGKPATSPAPAHKPPVPHEGAAAGGAHDAPPHPHSSETHGTSPHPVTGVHAIHIHHYAEGEHPEGHRFVTHTHHDGGEVAVHGHPHEQAMHDHVAEHFPPSNEEQHEDNAAEELAEAGHNPSMSSLGGEES